MDFNQGNLFARFDSPSAAEEQVLGLLTAPGIRIERIVSTGQASPPGFWFDQDQDEFVLLVCGAAELTIEGERTARSLGPGDYLTIPAHVRHRVEWTSSSVATIWLAVHYCPTEAART
jgi:cupin 2 domain-containing protein